MPTQRAPRPRREQHKIVERVEDNLRLAAADNQQQVVDSRQVIDSRPVAESLQVDNRLGVVWHSGWAHSRRACTEAHTSDTARQVEPDIEHTYRQAAYNPIAEGVAAEGWH